MATATAVFYLNASLRRHYPHQVPRVFLTRRLPLAPLKQQAGRGRRPQDPQRSPDGTPCAPALQCLRSH